MKNGDREYSETALNYENGAVSSGGDKFEIDIFKNIRQCGE